MSYFDELTNPKLQGKLWDKEGLKQIKEAQKRKKDFEDLKKAGVPHGALQREYAPPGLVAGLPDSPEVAWTLEIMGFKHKDPVTGQYYKELRRGPCVPGKKASKAYQEELKEEGYACKRYARLDRWVGDLLTEQPENIKEAKALFEMFYWKRVCFDEFHEVVRAKADGARSSTASRRATMYALNSLQGLRMWGLTGTPLLSSSRAVADMASLLRIFIPPGDEAEAQRWLDAWVRSNTWDKSSIEVEEHWVLVHLTPPERALYLSQRQVLNGARAEDGVNTRHAEERLLQLCTHFDPDNWQSESAGNAVKVTQEKRKAAIAKAEEGIRDCEARLADLKLRDEAREVIMALLRRHKVKLGPREQQQAFAHLQEPILLEMKHRAELIGSDTAPANVLGKELLAAAKLVRECASLGDYARAAAKAEEGGVSLCLGTALLQIGSVYTSCQTCQGLGDVHTTTVHLNRAKGSHEGKKKELESQVRYMDKALQGLENQSFECTFCLEQTDPTGKDAAVLTCGHAFHEECIQQSLAVSSLCPICRAPATARQATNLASLFSPKTLEAHSELKMKVGSKTASIVETLAAIREEGGDSEKCVVFIQWDVMMKHLEKAMLTAGMVPLVLRGSMAQRTKVIRSFMDDKSEKSSILLLSLEQSPSGMNLVCARNIFLVHPMHARNREEAINFERQAIGRVVRQGQKKKVRVYRFVTHDTIEEEISIRHHEEIFRMAMAEAKQPAGTPAEGVPRQLTVQFEEVESEEPGQRAQPTSKQLTAAQKRAMRRGSIPDFSDMEDFDSDDSDGALPALEPLASSSHASSSSASSSKRPRC